MDKYIHHTLYWACDYLSMLWLKLNHVSKRGTSGDIDVRAWTHNHIKYAIRLLIHIFTSDDWCEQNLPQTCDNLHPQTFLLLLCIFVYLQTTRHLCTGPHNLWSLCTTMTSCSPVTEVRYCGAFQVFFGINLILFLNKRPGCQWF